MSNHVLIAIHKAVVQEHTASTHVHPGTLKKEMWGLLSHVLFFVAKGFQMLYCGKSLERKRLLQNSDQQKINKLINKSSRIWNLMNWEKLKLSCRYKYRRAVNCIHDNWLKNKSGTTILSCLVLENIEQRFFLRQLCCWVGHSALAQGYYQAAPPGTLSFLMVAMLCKIVRCFVGCNPQPFYILKSLL